MSLVCLSAGSTDSDPLESPVWGSQLGHEQMCDSGSTWGWPGTWDSAWLGCEVKECLSEGNRPSVAMNLCR